jgi:ribosomal 50S subunit-recycling heat shock protein
MANVRREQAVAESRVKLVAFLRDRFDCCASRRAADRAIRGGAVWVNGVCTGATVASHQLEVGFVIEVSTSCPPLLVNKNLARLNDTHMPHHPYACMDGRLPANGLVRRLHVLDPS